MNYAYWNGSNWNIEKINTYPFDDSVYYSQLHLWIGTGENPRALYYEKNFAKENETGIICAMKSGSNWATYLIGRYDSKDLKVDSLGNVHMIYDHIIVRLYDDLKYATLSSAYFPTPPPQSSTFPDSVWWVIPALLLCAFAVAVLLRHKKRRAKVS